MNKKSLIALLFLLNLIFSNPTIDVLIAKTKNYEAGANLFPVEIIYPKAIMFDEASKKWKKWMEEALNTPEIGGATIRFVGAVNTDLVSGMRSDIYLEALESSTDTQTANVRYWRDKLGADVVLLLTEDFHLQQAGLQGYSKVYVTPAKPAHSNIVMKINGEENFNLEEEVETYRGEISLLGGAIPTDWAQWGPILFDQVVKSPNRTFQHEMGHLLGLQHQCRKLWYGDLNNTYLDNLPIETCPVTAFDETESVWDLSVVQNENTSKRFGERFASSHGSCQPLNKKWNEGWGEHTADGKTFNSIMAYQTKDIPGSYDVPTSGTHACGYGWGNYFTNATNESCVKDSLFSHCDYTNVPDFENEALTVTEQLPVLADLRTPPTILELDRPMRHEEYVVPQDFKIKTIELKPGFKSDPSGYADFLIVTAAPMAQKRSVKQVDDSIPQVKAEAPNFYSKIVVNDNRLKHLVYFKEDVKDIKIKVYSLSGREYYSIHHPGFKKGSFQNDYDISKFPPGMYVFQILGQGIYKTHKFVIK